MLRSTYFIILVISAGKSVGNHPKIPSSRCLVGWTSSTLTLQFNCTKLFNILDYLNSFQKLDQSECDGLELEDDATPGHPLALLLLHSRLPVM